MTDLWGKLDETVEELSRITDIKASAVVRRDGLVITHSLPDGVDPKLVAAMTAAIVGTSEMATEQLAQGHFERAVIESDGGKLISMGAGDEALLVALGLVLMGMEKVARRVDELLGRGGSS